MASNASFVGAREARAELARAVGPGDLQLVDIVAVDLRQRRMARAAGIAAVEAPLRLVVAGACATRAALPTPTAAT